MDAPSGSLALRLTGRAAALAGETGVRSWLIILTHSRNLAQALVAGLAPGSPSRLSGEQEG
ncbi:hypothetical protein ACWGH2_37130 [Streptomyces sp. NPDC054871]